MYKDEFLNYLKNERNFSPNTIQSYFNDLEQFFSFIKKESIHVKHVSSKNIRSWIVFNKEIGLESSTINRKISCLRTYFRFLMLVIGLLLIMRYRPKGILPEKIKHI